MSDDTNHRKQRVEDPTDGRFLSRAECRVLAARVAALRFGGGEAGVRIDSSWEGQTRYSRNTIRTSGDVLRNDVTVIRDIEGASAEVQGNQIDDVSLLACVRRAERLLRFGTQTGGTIFQEHFPIVDALVTDHVANSSSNSSLGASPSDSGARAATINPALQNESRMVAAARDSARREVGSDRAHDALTALGLSLTVQSPERQDAPRLFFANSYAMDPQRRATAIGALVKSATTQGMLASGYLETAAHGRAVMDTWGRMLYYPSTEARYSVTVRSPDGTGSGWAGVSWNDWTRVDPERIQAIALDKCLRSRNPVRIEPGRYTTILEPQAVHQLFFLVLTWMGTPLEIPHIDERLEASQDPMDPDCASMPFDVYGNAFHAATWYKNGVIPRRPHSRAVAIREYGENESHLFSGAYRLRASATTPLPEMIGTTQRGILLTRLLISGFDPPQIDAPVVAHGYTRDGTWLIENGKISKPVKNLRFRISVQGVLNAIEQIGVPQRVYAPEYPDPYLSDYAATVPALKTRDFNFVAVSDAV